MIFQIQICSRNLIRHVIFENKIFHISWKPKSTLYDVLNLKKDCSSKEIKDSYIELSKLHHPDRSQNSEMSHKQFLKINEAYNTLSKPDLRRNYDYELTQPQPPSGPKMNYDDFDWSMYHNPIFHKYKSGNSEDDDSYYGIKGLKKQSNSTIVLFCFFIIVLGISIRALAINNSSTLVMEKMMKENEANEILLNKIRSTSKLNGNELQIEFLRQRLEENEQKRKSR